MPFPKGQSGNSKGRPKQTEDQKKHKERFQTVLREATIPALLSVIEIASDKQNKDRLIACKFILDKAYGLNAAFLSDDETEPINIRIIRCNPGGKQERDTEDAWD